MSSRHFHHIVVAPPAEWPDDARGRQTPDTIDVDELVAELEEGRSR